MLGEPQVLFGRFWHRQNLKKVWKTVEKQRKNMKQSQPCDDHPRELQLRIPHLDKASSQTAWRAGWNENRSAVQKLWPRYWHCWGYMIVYYTFKKSFLTFYLSLFQHLSEHASPSQHERPWKTNSSWLWAHRSIEQFLHYSFIFALGTDQRAIFLLQKKGSHERELCLPPNVATPSTGTDTMVYIPSQDKQ